MVLFIAIAIAMFVRGVHDLLLAPAQEDRAERLLPVPGQVRSPRLGVSWSESPC